MNEEFQIVYDQKTMSNSTAIDLKEYQDLYNTTATEYLQKVKKGMAILKESIDPETITELYISFHSLKAQSLMMGYAQTGALSHVLEDVFSSLRKEPNPLSDLFQTLQQSVELLESSLASIKEHHKEQDLSEMMHILQEKWQTFSQQNKH